jgi:hypothetical protein
LAAYSEITIEQGATFSTTVNVNDVYNQPINLGGYSASSMMRKSYYSTTAYLINSTITNAVSGEITLSISSANTTILPVGRMVYDLIINDGANNITRVIEGIATILPSVTR